VNIEEIFPDGKWKDEYEYVIRCPVCGDHLTHDHCHVNPTKGVFHCFYKGCSGSVARLVKEYGGGAKIETRKGVIEKKKYLEIDFDQFKKVTGVGCTLDRFAFTYLKDRGVTREEIDEYDIRYATHGRYYGRVLFPVYEDNRLVNFVGRSFLRVVEPPYLFPHYGETLITSAEAIFGYSEVVNRPRGLYVIVEGVFDAIGVNKRRHDLGVRGLAILSNQISKGQVHKLLRLEGAGFFVMLDSDARQEAIKVGRLLHNYDRDVRIAFLKQGDPASVSDVEFDEALNTSAKFSIEVEMIGLEEKNG